jgi:hypothetical protein
MCVRVRGLNSLPCPTIRSWCDWSAGCSNRGGQGTGWLSVGNNDADSLQRNSRVSSLNTSYACAAELSSASVAGHPAAQDDGFVMATSSRSFIHPAGEAPPRSARLWATANASALRSSSRRARGNCCSRCRTRPVGTGTLRCAPRSMLIISLWAQSPGLVPRVCDALVYTTAGSTSDPFLVIKYSA